jgi:hypothetical protein
VKRKDGRCHQNTSSHLAVLARVVGDVVRDGGHVLFCADCRRAEVPGTLRCGRCGGNLGRVVRPGKRVKTEAA